MSKLDIRNCDNMELMREFPDKYFDLAIVDPPYGLKRLSVNENRSPDSKYRRSMSKMLDSAKKWNHLIPNNDYFNELFRVSKHQIIWGANNFELPPTEYFCIWNKHQTVNNFASAEYAYVSQSLKMPAKVFDYPIHRHNAEVDKIHPTEKPVALYRWLLKTYATCKTCEGSGEVPSLNINCDVQICGKCKGKKFSILDTHLGSGSIAVACYDYDFDLTACEINETHYEAAMKRINAHVAQQKLFV